MVGAPSAAARGPPARAVVRALGRLTGAVLVHWGDLSTMNSSSMVATVLVPAALAACCAVALRRNGSIREVDSTASALRADSGALATKREVTSTNRAVGPRADTSCAIGIYQAENARNASMLCAIAACGSRVSQPVGGCFSLTGNLQCAGLSPGCGLRSCSEPTLCSPSAENLSKARNHPGGGRHSPSVSG
jgi:hypothetical protein